MKQPPTPEWDRYEAVRSDWRVIETFIAWYELHTDKSLLDGTDWPGLEAMLLDYFHIDMDVVNEERLAMHRYADWRQRNPVLKWQRVAAILKQGGLAQISKDVPWGARKNGFMVAEGLQGSVRVEVYGAGSNRFRPTEEEQRIEHESQEAIRARAIELLTAAGLVVSGYDQFGVISVSNQVDDKEEKSRAGL